MGLRQAPVGATVKKSRVTQVKSIEWSVPLLLQEMQVSIYKACHLSPTREK